ncbi:hypothetical protein [Bradyrhizobium sp. BR 10289]|uniref:hypothetical protein n=1 Tax=Bradyrhizobium sp. BR 10289 TaxID=2749993 RepID=UPI001C64BAF1|nr:hypothetical protein [Bradyrhizobium sp. BR 10289]MBW7968106.1 hypothetical protein [Bradyrhizobium sp. BR 10289]
MATATLLDADARIKLTIGSQFCDLQILQDKVAALEAQLAAKDAELATLKAPQSAAPDGGSKAV